jgi:hypothetical protein
MTEEEILAGLKAVLEKYPNIIAWISMEPLYYACLARMPSVIALLTQWMERRNSFFTPAGEYAWMARAGMNYTDSDLAIGLRLDLPPIAREGEHNIPYYLVNKDFEAGDINLAHAIHSILMLKETPAEFVGIYARALASNTKMWQSIECASMNNYPILSNFIRCISHCVKKDETKITITPQRWAGNTPVVHELPARLVWHTLGTRCSLCVLDTHEGHTQYCDTCLPATPVDPVPKSPYETAIAEAAAIRRRRLRGILRCAAILVGKARLIHFVPPFGQKYLEAKARFEANSAL